MSEPENDRTEDEQGSSQKRVLLDREEWEDPKSRKVISEYHKDGLSERLATVEAELDRFEEYWSRKPSLESIKVREIPPTVPAEDIEEVEGERGRISRPIDTATLEVIIYALFRMFFRKGLEIPIKRPGLVDMDITIQGKEVIINTNELFYAMPELAVWRISYTHKGKTIAEFGRGIRRGFRVHIINAIALFFELWKMSRQNRKMKERIGIEAYQGQRGD